MRAGYVLGIPVAAAILWRLLREIANSPSWQTWVFSEHAEDGPYVVVLRAMFGFEDGVYLRQNLANAFIVNYLWLPTLLALVTLVLIFRRPAPRGCSARRRCCVGLAAIYAWTTLTYPDVHRAALRDAGDRAHAAGRAASACGCGRARAQPFILGALLLVFVAGAWSPTDPVSRKIWGTTSVGGEQIYDTAERQRGPDRMNINFATLNATERIERAPAPDLRLRARRSWPATATR